MVINQKFFGADSIFSIITTVVMVFVSIFTAGSAICIAWTQRKNGKRNHLNNLSVEFVTDFIQPLEEYEVSIKNKFEVLHDLDTDKERVKVMIGALGNINVHTEFLYWEQHKGDIENALKKKENDKNVGEEFSNIYEFVKAARKFKSDINNMQKEMSHFLEGDETPKGHKFDEDDIKNTGGTLIGNMLKITKKLPRELKINEVINEIKNNRGM